MSMRDIAFYLVSKLYPVAIYYWVMWSRVNRFFTKGMYSKTLFTRLTPFGAQTFMNELPWSPDRWYDLFDVAGSPHKFQYSLDVRGQTGAVLSTSRDCDDFAGWAAAVIDPAYSPRILAVSYQRAGAVLPSGHVVCAVNEGDVSFHVGNWGKSDIVAAGDNFALALDVARQCKARFVGYALLDKDLRVIEIRRG